MIIREYDNCDQIIMIYSGTVEVYSEFEGNEFVLEKLGQGSILNHRAFFMEDLMYVNVRCATPVITYVIDTSLF